MPSSRTSYCAGWILALQSACLGDPLVGASGDESSSSTTIGPESASNSAPGSMSADATSAADTSSSSPGTSTADSGEAESGCPFICDSDAGSEPFECSMWDQDCKPGEKCMPWANDGGSSWNATRCTPLDDMPAAPGEPCTVVDSGASGIDDCERAAMCWDVDPETNMGECVAFCEGSESNPTCADPSTECKISGDGILIICLPGCDPLAQDCSAGLTCYPDDSQEQFICAPDAGGENGAYGEPCEFLNVCDPGLYCADAALVPGCMSQRCCNNLCDVTLGDDASCSGAAEGQLCVPWFEPGEAPPGLANVGACALPE